MHIRGLNKIASSQQKIKRDRSKVQPHRFNPRNTKRMYHAHHEYY